MVPQGDDSFPTVKTSGVTSGCRVARSHVDASTTRLFRRPDGLWTDMEIEREREKEESIRAVRLGDKRATYAACCCRALF